MSSKHSSDFYYLEFKLKSGKKLTAPLLFPKTILPQNDQTELAREFKYSIQKYWLNDGRYARFMRFQLQNKPEKTSIEVDFNATSNKYSFPKLNLSFDVFFTQIDETDFIGFVPVLGIEALGANKEALMQNLEANIRQEFARSGRLKSVASILSTQWHEKVTSKKEIVEFEFHNFNELEQIRKGRKESLLKGLGHPMTSNAVYRVGMDQHEEKLQRAIQGKVAGCVLVVGPSGSGKSVLIRSSLVNLNQHTDVFETDAGRFFQGLMGASGWQGKLAEVCKELRENEKILYVKNLAALFEVGRYEGNSTSIGEFLRSYIERGELRLLTECSPEEAAYLEARYPGYLKAFHTVRIEQPENEEIRYIVIEKLNWLANSMNIVLEDDAVDEILQLHMRYAPYSGYPGKNLRFMESLLRNRKQLDTKLPLGKDAVIDAFCQESGMPRFMVDPSIPLRPDKLAAFFAKRVFGQDIARQRIGSLLLSVKTGLARSGKPIASLLFAGPTGVGKTELSKAIAEFIFGSQDRISRFDMSEYADPASVLRLTGDTQTSGEGLLTRQVRQQPFSVILFDELEKAHYSFFDLLLQITGEGRLTDARGQVADFCSSVIVMTSNLGAKDYGKASVGFVQATGNHADIEQHFREAVQGYFKPEMVNRFDDIIAFSPLDNSLLNQLANREIVKVFERVKQQNQGVQFKKSADSVNTLATLGFDARYGARHLGIFINLVKCEVKP
ncbi:MAG: AAA family ATPase [Candidatus Thiodiazotropha sp.]